MGVAFILGGFAAYLDSVAKRHYCDRGSEVKRNVQRVKVTP